MKTEKLELAYSDLCNEVYTITKDNVDSFLQDNNIVDRLNLKDELFTYKHTVLFKTSFNDDEYTIVNIERDIDPVSYVFEKDTTSTIKLNCNTGKLEECIEKEVKPNRLVLCLSSDDYGIQYTRFLHRVVNGLEYELPPSIDDIVESLTNGQFKQAKEEIERSLDDGFNVLEEMNDFNGYIISEHKDYILKSVVRYLANNPTRSARITFQNWD